MMSLLSLPLWTVDIHSDYSAYPDLRRSPHGCPLHPQLVSHLTALIEAIYLCTWHCVALTTLWDVLSLDPFLSCLSHRHCRTWFYEQCDIISISIASLAYRAEWSSEKPGSGGSVPILENFWSLNTLLVQPGLLARLFSVVYLHAGGFVVTSLTRPGICSSSSTLCYDLCVKNTYIFYSIEEES